MARTKRQPRRQTEKPDLLQGPGLFVRFGWRFLIIPLSFGKNQQRVGPMKDYQAQLEKLRKDAAECALIRDLATDPAKRAMFDRLAVHLSSLADQVEHAMLHRNDETGA